jgi:hypothetical protein
MISFLHVVVEEEHSQEEASTQEPSNERYKKMIMAKKKS